MNRIKWCLNLWIAFLFLSFPCETPGCTGAVVSVGASADGAPLLWKNRDTGFLSNKVIFVKEHPYRFIGIVNAHETSGRFVYAGLNSEGFAIINTVAYNLPKNEGEVHDLEGQIMSDALRKCRTTADFEAYLQANTGESLGSWSTFGVIDAEGGAELFEVHNNGYYKLNAAAEKKKYLVVTNFARNGKIGQGEGYLRFERASLLFNKLKIPEIAPEIIFRHISRDIGNVLVKHPASPEISKSSLTDPLWIHSRNCINRPSTSAAIIIQGKKAGDPESRATLWVILGEPVTSAAIPLWVEAGEVPAVLWEGKTAPLCAESLRIKKLIHPFAEGSKKNYLNTSRLLNREGTGFLPLLLKLEKKIFHETSRLLESEAGPGELRKFQNRSAEDLLTLLKSIK